MNMRNTTLLSIASAAAIALPFAAQAADQAVPFRRAAPVVVQTFNWTGVYIGAYGGQVTEGSNDHLSGQPLFCNSVSGRRPGEVRTPPAACPARRHRRSRPLAPSRAPRFRLFRTV